MERDWKALIVPVLIGATLTGFVTYYATDRANRAGEVRKLNQDEQQKLSEFTSLVNQIDANISSKDYVKFQENTHNLMAILIGGQYDRAIGIEQMPSNQNKDFQLIVRTVQFAITAHYALCENEMLNRQKAYKDGCQAASLSDIDTAIGALKEALVHRAIYRRYALSNQ